MMLTTEFKYLGNVYIWILSYHQSGYSRQINYALCQENSQEVGILFQKGMQLYNK